MEERLNHDNVEFCFANVNGDLKVKLKNFEINGRKFIDVKNESDIEFILQKLDGSFDVIDELADEYDNTDDENISNHSNELF